MPTKPNKAGEQQNYVPAGNGDASGEYGDNATGSNIHFTNFKKPDDDTPQVEKPTPKPTIKVEKPEGEGSISQNEKKKASDNLVDNFSSHCENPTEENKKTFQQLNDETSEEGKSILNQYISSNEKFSIRFGGAGRNAAGVCYGNEIVSNHEIHTIRHEVGHSIDKFYGDTYKDKSKLTATLGSAKLSMSYIDEVEGKTFNEVLHEEMGKTPYHITLQGWRIREIKTGKDNREQVREKFIPIFKAYNELGNKYFDELSGVKGAREKLNALKTKYNEANDSARTESRNTPEGIEYEELNKKVYEVEGEYANEQIKKGAWQIIYADSPKVQEARKLRDSARDKMEAKRKELFDNHISKEEIDEMERLDKIKNFKVGDKLEGFRGVIGDLEDYAGVGGAYYTTRGHGEGYFKSRKTDGIGMEVFANMFDVYCCNRSEVKEALKKSLPRTSAVFDRIIAKVFKKGEKK